MRTLQEIETAIIQLPSKDRVVSRDWFAELDAAAWDQQFEQDVVAGRLDQFAQQALEDLPEGRCTDL